MDKIEDQRQIGRRYQRDQRYKNCCYNKLACLIYKNFSALFKGTAGASLFKEKASVEI